MPIATATEPETQPHLFEPPPPPVFCEGCADEVPRLHDDGRGDCCHNLPARWVRGSDGLYNRVAESDPDVPTCGCGSVEWTVAGSQQVRSSEHGETIYYETCDFELEVHCAICGAATGYRLEEEE